MPYRDHFSSSTTHVGVALIALGVGSVAMGEVVSLDSIAHGTLYETAGSPLANGLGSHLFAGNNGQDLSRRGLIRFDIGSLGPNIVVSSAILRLHVSQANASPRDVSLHRVLADWGVGSTDAPGGEGGGGPATPGSATWNDAFYDTTPWTNAGGDFAGVASAITEVGGNGWYEWSSAGLVQDVQQMLDGGFDDFGWILLGDESMASTAKRFDSMFAAEEFRPELVVEFSVVPGPSVWSAIVLSGMGSRRRGRRRGKSA